MLMRSFKEEWHNLFENKMNLVLLFIMPIVIVILISLEFSSGVISNIPMAVIDYDNSNFSRQLIDSFDQNNTFDVISYAEDESDMEYLIKNSKVRVGMIIPEGFYNDVTLLNSPTVEMFYDGSHMSITSVAKSKAMEILLTYKAGATMKQLETRLNLSSDQAFNITQAFQFNNRKLYNSSQNFESFLAPILMAGVVQSAIVLVAAVSINHDIYFTDRKRRFGYASGKILFYSACGTVTYLLCVLIQITVFQLPFKGSIIDVVILSAAFSLAISSFSVLISSLMKTRIIALVAAAVVFIPNSVMAGTTWPLISMPIGYQGFGKIMPFARFVNNLRNIYLKGISMTELKTDVLYLFGFGIAFLLFTEFVIRIMSQQFNQEEEIHEELFRVI